MAGIIYPELCYRLNGLCYEIHNVMGSVYSERQYQDAFEAKLKLNTLVYEREKDLGFKFGNNVISGNKIDFIVEGKVAVDLKAKKYITRDDFRQMLRYVRSGRFKLGLIVNFGSRRVTIKRVVNSAIRI